MGEVYRAIDSVLHRPVAVKLLSPHYARDPESRARFEREALAAARLSKERHVVTVFDVGEHHGRPLIVMEYLDGGSVHDRLARGPVPREQALEWLEQVADALDRAHAHGIVHRDVKPANLLLDSDGNVRVADFGIASTAGLESVTLPGTILGTAGYISPEQARGEQATPASDRYSLAVIAFELLTGRRPFEGETATTQALAHVTAPIPSAERIAPHLPPGVDRVLERGLAKDPAERPATARELVSELQAVFDRAAAQAAGSSAERTRALPPDGNGASPQQLPATRVDPRQDMRRYGARDDAGAASGRALASGRRGARPAALVGLVAVAVLLAAIVAGFDLVGSGGGKPGATARDRAPAAPRAEEEQAAPPPPVDGAALDRQGFALMKQGRFEEALPILRRAVGALRGSNSRAEAYASYNLAFTRFALGACSGVVGLLDRSERIQGHRHEIDRLREQWKDRCADDGERKDDEDEDEGDD